MSESPEYLDSDYNEKYLYQVWKMSLEETKEKRDWRKRAFEYEQNNSYGIENINDMMNIHNNEVKNIAEYNLIHDIINPPKQAKTIIAITLLLYMDVWIPEKVNRGLKLYASYWAVDLVSRL